MSDKKYKTISEVSILLGVNQHVIRYWDSKFDGISTRLSTKKHRFFNVENIKKIKKIINFNKTKNKNLNFLDVNYLNKIKDNLTKLLEI